MTKTALLLACLLGAASFAHAQEPGGDVWGPLRPFLGEWRGAIAGEEGKGQVARRYRFILGGSYLQERERTSFPPQPLHPDGAVSERASFYLYDKNRKTLLFRHLRQEAYSGTYVMSQALSSPTKLVFESEHLDGSPTTWKARETHELVSPSEDLVTFEVAKEGQPFVVLSRITFKRQ
jgi:hypothetical protein